MALAVCLLFDARTDRALRHLWERLEDAGVPTLLSHTHGRHVPHLSYAVLRQFEVNAVQAAVAALPDDGPVPLHFDALGLFRRSRAWLVPGVTASVLERQERGGGRGAGVRGRASPPLPAGLLGSALLGGTRVRRESLAVLAAAVFEILPLEAVADRAALIDSSTGERWPLPGVP